ncbi:MAG: type IX secretion system membrane protein PorP/SprF [Cytophagales bacterium]|nr:type IX secretion system membrane protein PorP/SprF [Cytophagales bacterium]
MNYKNQGLSHQADVGAYYIFEPLLVGLWYSGFVTPRVDGTGINNESINGLIGVKTGGGFYFGYSYDFPLTELRPAHEVSITYEFSTRDPRKPDKYKMRLPCPWL